ncbi:SgcJ/EcaC family oxidoreductase [Sphaerimonospora thailandensis]|uniref:Steroid Delta-isomerase n=1 Tax=Sphaerimonospora thailandensis TaxID=795644 RepID=A0A8J3R3V4_9ACTN|nr:SgcJ/EcaC family oxidoreductase [Sphaerimonospora thailandensis]GIH67868.1 steroid Delta-isomerase [Sphaerimonospora thailandensis]
MPTPKEALQGYIDAWNAGDAEAIIALFADDAVIVDPYGTPPHEGRDAIRAFYEGGVKTGAKLSLDTPIRGSHGDRAAMAFTVELALEGAARRIRVIDVMTFDEHGKISRMEAHWGPDDMEQS